MNNLAHFHGVMTPSSGRGQGPGSANGVDEPLDPYDGPPAWPITPDEMTPEQQMDATFEMRMLDAPGQDTAYDLGLSERRRPAPKGGWPLDTDPVELSI